MADLQGSYDELFAAAPTVLAKLLDDGDAGGSVAVFVDGQPVVDVWGGFADPQRTKPWQQDTITSVFSVTKTMTALCALILADRGQLDLDAPVIRYWPEFATAGQGRTNGKDQVLVRHLLSHTAGLPDWTGPIEEIYDWPAATARLAAEALQWEPGTAAGYHSLTQGFLVGEVIRRITGQSVGDFFAENVAGPLGADFHFGLPAEDDHRLALTVPPPGQGEDYVAGAAASDAPQTAGTPIRVRDANSLAWRRAQIPAAGGYGNARSVALVQSVLACGGVVRGQRILSQAMCDRAGEAQFDGVDRVLGRSMRWGLGYGLFGRALGWGGWGGAIVMIEPDPHLTVAYVTNQMREPADDTRGMEIIMAAYEGLQTLRT
jgi:CubicO group peptidase (beta-lactamase class C family)